MLNWKNTPVIGLALLLAGCNFFGGSASQPPLPTIVPVTETPQPTTTNIAAESEPEATAINTVDNLPETNSQSEESPTLPPTNTPEPTPVPTTVVASATVAPPTEPLLTPTPTPVPATPTPPAVQLPSLAEINPTLVPVADGFTRPVFLTHAGDGSGRLFVVEQPGRILILIDGNVNPEPFLDIASLVGSDANEQGLLSVAFHPDYVTNGFFYLNYTNKQGDTVIARYNRSDNPDVADPNSAKILMTIGQPYANHNGGQIAFGPGGYLYIGMGDGGAGGDPQNRAQDLGTLLGKILRIDVNNGEPYGVPENNPFVDNAPARPEIWSYGWRNPWRFSFDAATGDMYIADVGQNQYEEVHVEWANTPGQNYGWRLMEGFHCFNPNTCDPSALGLVLPVVEYDHGSGCSITGGYVYRGTRFPAFTGTYFYGDYCSGIIWGIRSEADGRWSEAELLRSDKTISSFGQDETGELYLVNHKGNIFRLEN